MAADLMLEVIREEKKLRTRREIRIGRLMRIRGHREGRDGQGEEGTEEELSVALGWECWTGWRIGSEDCGVGGF